MRPWWPLVAVCLGTFMLLVDVTIVNVALPPIAASLGTTFAALQWVIDGYALALAALLMVTGTLADRFGRRAFYLAGLGVFAVASLACGLAPSAGALVAARVVQGAGGAAMFATTAALHRHDLPRPAPRHGLRRLGRGQRARRRVRPAARRSAHPGLGLARDLPGQPAGRRARGGAHPRGGHRVGHAASRGRIDVLGAASFTVASAALVYGLVSAGEQGWGATTTVLALALAAVALVVFLVVEHRGAAPMLDLALFRNPSFTALMTAALVLQAAAFAHLALVSLWLQSVLGLTPIRAGLVVIPLSVAAFAVSVTAGRFLHGGSPARPVAGGLILVGAGALLMTRLGPASGPSALLLGLVVSGLGVGLATPVLVSATLAVLPPHRAGVGSAAVNTFRQLGLAVGLAVLATVFAGRVATVLTGAGVADPTTTANALAGGRAGQVPVPDATVHQAFASGLDTVFTVAGVCALVAAVAGRGVRSGGAGRGAVPRGRGARPGPLIRAKGPLARTGRARDPSVMTVVRRHHCGRSGPPGVIAIRVVTCS